MRLDPEQERRGEPPARHGKADAAGGANRDQDPGFPDEQARDVATRRALTSIGASILASATVMAGATDASACRVRMTTRGR